MNEGFWAALDRLIEGARIIIDRPKGTRHPRFHAFVYPVDYGYIEGTTSMDGYGIDVYIGTLGGKTPSGVIITVDLIKRDSEIKLLIGCTDDETQAILKAHNATESMKGLLVMRS